MKDIRKKQMAILKKYKMKQGDSDLKNAFTKWSKKIGKLKFDNVYRVHRQKQLLQKYTLKLHLLN